MQRLYESLGRALLFGILGAILSSLVYWVHPVFGGIALVATIIVVSVFVFQAANQVSGQILKGLTG